MTPQSDEDEVWRQIVASFNEPTEATTSGGQPWPDSENLPAEPARKVVKRPDDDAQPPPRPAAPSAAEDDEPGGFVEDDADDERPAEEDEGHFVPPPPPPVPKADMSTKLAWLALFGGPAYLLLAAVLGWHMQGWALFAAGAAFIGGFVALVVRMGEGPNDSGHDDGAVV